MRRSRVLRRSSLRPRWILALLHAAPAGRPGPVQQIAAPPQPPQKPVFRSGVNLVQVDVVALGPGNRPVGDLSKDDLQVFENGVAKEIASFARVALPVPPPQPPATADVATNAGVDEGRAGLPAARRRERVGGADRGASSRRRGDWWSASAAGPGGAPVDQPQQAGRARVHQRPRGDPAGHRRVRGGAVPDRASPGAWRRPGVARVVRGPVRGRAGICRRWASKECSTRTGPISPCRTSASISRPSPEGERSSSTSGRAPSALPAR